VVIYHMLKENRDYVDLGAKFLDQIRSQHLIRFHTKRLEELGLKVLTTPMAA
ncbi:MAG: IS110 family transposase, partial [Candidatus Angelobacter sp. Gp1-AA117]